MSLAYDRLGVGEPLVLVHGLGSHRMVWEPVLEPLAASYDVIAVDLPGFGDSAPLGVEPTPVALAGAVSDFLAEQGIERPHVAGNSLGGWVALELARQGQVRSVTALSPAGLWRERSSLATRLQISMTRTLAVAGRPASPLLARSRLLRVATMSFSYARPGDVPGEAAVRDAQAFAAAPSFWPAFRAANVRRFEGGQRIDVPVTVAFGAKDRLLVPARNAARDQLPPHTRDVRLEGCGHASMWDDPAAVVRVIRETTAAARG